MEHSIGIREAVLRFCDRSTANDAASFNQRLAGGSASGAKPSLQLDHHSADGTVRLALLIVEWLMLTTFPVCAVSDPALRRGEPSLDAAAWGRFSPA